MHVGAGAVVGGEEDGGGGVVDDADTGVAVDAEG